MPIGLGMASSHAPSLKARTFEAWENIHEFLNKGIVQPLATELETQEVIEKDFIPRVVANFKVLEEQVKAYKPDLLVIIGGDQAEMFDRSNVANLMIYTGDEAWGQNNNLLAGEEPSEETLLRLKVDAASSKKLLEQLMKDGFDVNWSSELRPLGRPQRGTPHAFITPAPFLMPELNIPTVLVYENTYDPPSLSAKRCYEVGKAIARAFKNDPRRIAIYGSGGLSHDPRGPRSGWIDEPLDNWVLDQIKDGTPEALQALYTFDSMTMRAGTGEIRSWITVAGAMDEMGQLRGNVVDYMPAHKSVTGCGWAYWNVEEKVAAASDD